MNKCLICYNVLNDTENHYHTNCLKKSFIKDIDPIVPYNYSMLQDLATQIISESFTITGVQTKISLTTSKNEDIKKFTIVGYKSNYILKPPSAHYQQLPENEDLTMKLANLAKIKTVQHLLVPMLSGEIAYLTKRIDRTDTNKKIHMEDMAQITGKLTEHKYLSSVETIGKHIYRYSENKMFDVISFFDIILFCLITGNADMHLKNFSLIYNHQSIVLAPAYDLLNTKIISKDEEESALTIDGKKRNITRNNLNTLAATLRIPEKARDNIYSKYSNLLDPFHTLINKSLLNSDLKKKYNHYLNSLTARLKL